MNVYGVCTADSDCVDQCTCAPCSHLANATYNVNVVPSSQVSAEEDTSDSFCPNLPHGQQCAAECPVASSSGGALSTGAKVGIAFAVIFVVGLLLILVYCSFFSKVS
jgi:hypothetical protein